MKKKLFALGLAGIMAASALTGCGSSQPAPTQAPAATEAPKAEAAAPAETEAAAPAGFVATNPVTFNISSKAGGNSDLIIRTITDICTKEGLVEPTFVVVNNPDGLGNIVRIETHESADPDHTLLCMSAGDLQSMLTSDVGLTLDDFAPIATLAADKQLLFVRKGGKYSSFEEIMADIENGVTINVAGTSSNEMKVFNMFAEEINKVDSFNYMIYDSSSESITALLGDHVEVAVGSPAAAISYVESGDIIPIVAFSDSHFMAPLDTAPTMDELGYNVVQSPMWRGIVAPDKMSDEAKQFWNDAFGKATETDAWAEYLGKYLLSPYFNDLEATNEIMHNTQASILEENK